MISANVEDTLRLILPCELHHLGRGAEEFLGRTLLHLQLSDQLLDAVDDLLRVFHSQLNGMTEVLLEHVFGRGFHHHCEQTEDR